MENLQDQVQKARDLERAHKNGAALDVFLRLAGAEGAHQEDPAFWSRFADLSRRTERPEVAAEAYPRAVDLLERAGHRNSALAVARRSAAMDAGSPLPHLRLGDLGAALGYGGFARDGYLRALEVAEGDEIRDPAIEGLRAAWALLRRAGRHDEADEVRGRILEVQPDADPLDDPSLDAPDPLAAVEAPDLEEDADPGAAPPAGLQPTVVPGAAGQMDVAQMEGLEPTSAGDEWAEDRAAEPADERDDLPGHPDLPLLRSAPEVEEPDAEDGLPLPGLVPRAGEADDDAAEEEVETGDLPLLSTAPELPPIDDEGALAPPVSDLHPAEDSKAANRAPPGQAPASPEAASRPVPPAADEGSEVPARRGGSRGEPDGGYIDLGALILSDDEEEVTRFRIEAQPPSGDEDKDFEEILGAFRQQVSEKIDPADSVSHYDLGLAFKDMGLLDDAIGQLQVALRGGSEPLSTLEVLGECFIEKGEHSLAARVMERATQIPGTSESDLIGVLYWLGRTQESLQDADAARGYYERVVALDITFRDAAARLASLRSTAGGQDDT